MLVTSVRSSWEYTHRFVGWAVVFDLIAHLGVKAALLPKGMALLSLINTVLHVLIF